MVKTAQWSGDPRHIVPRSLRAGGELYSLSLFGKHLYRLGRTVREEPDGVLLDLSLSLSLQLLSRPTSWAASEKTQSKLCYNNLS